MNHHLTIPQHIRSSINKDLEKTHLVLIQTHDLHLRDFFIERTFGMTLQESVNLLNKNETIPYSYKQFLKKCSALQNVYAFPSQDLFLLQYKTPKVIKNCKFLSIITKKIPKTSMFPIETPSDKSLSLTMKDLCQQYNKQKFQVKLEDVEKEVIQIEDDFYDKEQPSQIKECTQSPINEFTQSPQQQITQSPINELVKNQPSQIKELTQPPQQLTSQSPQIKESINKELVKPIDFTKNKELPEIKQSEKRSKKQKALPKKKKSLKINISSELPNKSFLDSNKSSNESSNNLQKQNSFQKIQDFLQQMPASNPMQQMQPSQQQYQSFDQLITTPPQSQHQPFFQQQSMIDDSEWGLQKIDSLNNNYTPSQDQLDHSNNPFADLDDYQPPTMNKSPLFSFE